MTDMIVVDVSIISGYYRHIIWRAFDFSWPRLSRWFGSIQWGHGSVRTRDQSPLRFKEGIREEMIRDVMCKIWSRMYKRYVKEEKWCQEVVCLIAEGTAWKKTWPALKHSGLIGEFCVYGFLMGML